jgi:membrane-associated protease RseP (regulator of RpoE activity)
MSDTQLKPPLPDEPITARGDIPGKVGLAALIGGTVALGIFGGWSILIIVLSLVFMIFMHELGHYLTAKAAGMKVTEFFIGFGPRIWSFRRGETEYGFKAIPAGAYVRIIGMNNLDEVPPADEARTYRQKSYPRRMSVAVAGSTMHFLMAFALGIGSLVLYGSVTEDDSNWEIGQVSTAEETLTGFPADELTPSLTRQLEDGETPALEAGIREGDRIVAADDEEIETYAEMRDFTLAHPGDEVVFVIERGDETVEATVVLAERVLDGETVGYLGVQDAQVLEPMGAIDAVQTSAQEVGTLMVESIKGIGRFFSPDGLSSFADVVMNAQDEEADTEPGSGGGGSGGSSSASEDESRIISIVGAARIGAQATDANGLYALMRFMMLLNVFIGVFNLLPLLPFDGGHVAVGTYERIREIGTGRRYQADITKLLPLTYAVVLFMVTIGSLALYVDLFDPINLQ